MTAIPAGRWTGHGVHRTQTSTWTTGERYKTKSNGSCGRWVYTYAARATCLCGWRADAEDRGEAQRRARVHRATVTVAEADLSALVMLLCEHAMPWELHPLLRRLDDTVREFAADRRVEAPLVDLRPLLRQANRPWAFAEHPYIPRLIAAADAVAVPWERVGMLDSVASWCAILAGSHGMEVDEWLPLVQPAADD